MFLTSQPLVKGQSRNDIRTRASSHQQSARRATVRQDTHSYNCTRIRDQAVVVVMIVVADAVVVLCSRVTMILVLMMVTVVKAQKH